jgi:hypothetical protein
MGVEPLFKQAKRANVGGFSRQRSGGVLRQIGGFELFLGQAREAKPRRPQLSQGFLLGLAGRRNEYGMGAQGRQVQLRAVPAPAYHSPGFLER